MPANVSTLLSTGVSVGIIAGVVSGLFYLVVAGIRWAGEVRHQSRSWLHRRFAPSSTDRDSRDGSVMESESCHVRDFVERLVESLVSGSLDRVNVNRLYTHPEYDRMFDTYHDPLCEVLARLSFALQMAIANMPLEDCDSPSAAHTELKHLVQRVVQEAMTLPALHKISENGSANGHMRSRESDAKTYEDILATAILNKVIQRCQCGLRAAGTDGNTNSLYRLRAMDQPTFGSCVELGVSRASSVDEVSTTSLHDADVSCSDFSQEAPSLTLDEEDEDEDGEGDVEATSSDEAASGRGAELDFYLSGLNFIKRHRVAFPELGMDLVDGGEPLDEEAESTPTDLMTPADSWEENWLFQRRRLKGSSLQPLAVPMLVPNPSEDFRALIGDQDAEDTSDLSDCSEGIYEGLLEARAMAGKAKRGDAASLQDTTDAANMDVANGDSWSECGQLDSEYTEDYAAVTQRQMNSLRRDSGLHALDTSRPVPKPRTSAPPDLPLDSVDVNVVDATVAADEDVEAADELASPPRPGTIAEREHKKWETAPPLRNNPYSSENIQKRLNKSSRLDIRPTCQEKVELPDKVSPPTSVKASVKSPTDANIARYGRDYYVNESKAAQGRNIIHPVKIVPLPATEPSRPETKVAEESKQPLPSIGNTVSQWQTEINQREELWRKNVSHNKKEANNLVNKPKETNNLVNKPKETNHLVSKPKEQFVIKKGQNNILPKKEIIIIEKPNKSELSLNDTILQAVTEKSQTVDKPTCRNGLNDRVQVNTKQDKVISAKNKSSENQTERVSAKDKVGVERKSMTGDNTQCYVNGKYEVSSLEVDKSTLFNMPSVKDLAKQFTVPRELNDSPQSLIASPAAKKVLGLQVGQPMREVHSLTARSISREFREELRRNLPPPLRNKPGSECSASRSTTPGDTSDDSSAASGSLRNNIAFWEQMKHK